VRHLELEHHDGDDDGDHAVAECFESRRIHGKLAPTMHKAYLIAAALAWPASARIPALPTQSCAPRPGSRARHAQGIGRDRYHARPRLDRRGDGHSDLARGRRLFGIGPRAHRSGRSPGQGKPRGALPGRIQARRALHGTPRCGGCQPGDWSVDPFKLTQKDDWFYGRAPST